MTFGSGPEDIPSEIGDTITAALDAVKDSWKETDQARPPILNNTMETEHKRLDRLDQFADKRRKQVDAVPYKTLTPK